MRIKPKMRVAQVVKNGFMAKNEAQKPALSLSITLFCSF